MCFYFSTFHSCVWPAAAAAFRSQSEAADWKHLCLFERSLSTNLWWEMKNVSVPTFLHTDTHTDTHVTSPAVYSAAAHKNTPSDGAEEKNLTPEKISRALLLIQCHDASVSRGVFQIASLCAKHNILSADVCEVRSHRAACSALLVTPSVERRTLHGLNQRHV